MTWPLNTLLLIWKRFSWRYWSRHWLKSLTLLAIFAVGIATFLSIMMANRTAVVSFSGFTESLAGESDWVLRSRAGHLEEQALGKIRETLGETPLHLIPILESTAVLPRQPNEPKFGRPQFRILGVDLIGIQNIPIGSKNLKNAQFADGIPQLLGKPSLLIAPKIAETYGLSPGDTWNLIVQESVESFEVAGILPVGEGAYTTPHDLILMDLPSLQTAAALKGKLDRIECFLPSSQNAAFQKSRIGGILSELDNETWRVETTESNRQSTSTMTSAFRLNLLVLSLISLLVALYLIAQALDASVVRRRKEIGILRSLGVSRKTLQYAWLFEVSVFGVVGSAMGILLAWGMAQIFVQAVSQTINALYHTTSEHAVSLLPIDIALGFIIGIPASIIAGLLPAQDAASTPPAEVLKRGNESEGLSLFKNTKLGYGMILAGMVFYFFPPFPLTGGNRFPLAGYIAAFLWLIGGTITIGSLFRPLARLMKQCFRSSASWQLAASRLHRANSRHKFAVSGLFVSGAMAISMSLLIASFSRTMETWIDTAFKADVYIASGGAQSADAINKISLNVWTAIKSHPNVEAANIFQRFPIEIDGISTFVAGTDLDVVMKYDLLAWIHKPPPGKALNNVYASESFTERFKLSAGDTVIIPTPSGSQKLNIAGVFADYGNERGSLLMERDTVSKWFKNRNVTNLSLFLKPGVSPEKTLNQFKDLYPNLTYNLNESLRSGILTIFRQTFAITEAIKGIGVFVALVGLALAMLSLLWESKHQLAVLKALGMKRNCISKTVAFEGFGLAATGLVGSLILSIPLGHLLIYVINKQSFGWTLQFAVPWMEIGAISILILLSGTLTAYCIGHHVSKKVLHV